jgi:hypothetical protein
MSTSPEPISRPENEMISLLSHWLARHVDTLELRQRLDAVGTGGLSPGQAEVVDELLGELRSEVPRARLEPVVRETLEALALGF